jgi:hypothetical protein
MPPRAKNPFTLTLVPLLIDRISGAHETFEACLKFVTMLTARDEKEPPV